MKYTKKKSEDLFKVHFEALKRYEESFSAEREQREACLHDTRFTWVPGSQWEDSITAAYKNRPRMEINKVKLPVSQLIGEQKQNRVSTKVRPTKDGATQEIADVLNGMIRYINYKSSFNTIKDQAFKEQITGGIAGWYVSTQYEDDSFDQEIVIKPIVSAASSVYYDPAATGELKEDAQWFMVTEDMGKTEFMKRYPNATVSNLSSPTSSTSINWQDRDTIRIADYWVKEPCVQTLALMSDGSVMEITKESQSILDELALEGVTVVKTRSKESHKVRMYKISAGEVLEGPFEWAGKDIPVVVFFGFNLWVDGQHYYQGMVRQAIDSQRIYNYSVSAMVEAVALSPKDPYFVTKTQVKGLETQYANYNNDNKPFMIYNPDPDAPGAPQRGGAPSVQSALIGVIQQSDMDVQSTTGLFSPSLGNEQQDQSGKAILALQQKGHLSTFDLVDNLNKAIEHTSKILIDLIPKIYDTERAANILQLDGESVAVEINKTIIDRQTGSEVKVNDLSKGKYSIIASTGPSFESQKVENINILTRLAESNPAIAPLITDLIAKSLDSDFSEELTSRIRKMMINQGLISPNNVEAQEMRGQMEQQQQEVMLTKELQLEQAVLQNSLLKAQIQNVVNQSAKIESDVKTDKLQMLEVLADTSETISKSMKNKVDASKTLDEQGITANVPIASELMLSQAVNSELEQTLGTDPFI